MNEAKLVEMQKNVKDNNEELQDFLRTVENWEKNVKDNDEEVQDFLRTMEKWEKDMKHKDEWWRQKVKKRSDISSDEDSEAEEKLMDLLRKQGNEAKEKGNKHFKRGEWNKAIECYTKGLAIDPYNPLLSANRAMALLKIGSFAAAEADCNQCLSLDDMYVKAYLRRAAARYELQKYDQAKEDVKKVIEIEPANAEAKKLLKSLYQHYGKDSEDDNQPSHKPDKEMLPEISKKPPSKKESPKNVTFKPENQPKVFTEIDSKSVISPVQNPSHLRSKVPLKKIIVELEKEEIPLKLDAPWRPCKSCTTTTTTATTTVTVKKDAGIIQQTKVAEIISESTSTPPCPNSFIEFQRGWEKVYAVTNVAFKYLTQIPADCYPRLFGDLLESDVMSQMLHVLSRGAADEAIEPLRALTTVSRFGMLKLFMSAEDKKAVQRILDSFCSTDGLGEQLSNAYLS